MRQRIGISATGLVTPLGRGKDQVCRALFRGSREGLVARDDLIAGKVVHVGEVAGDLPEIPAGLERFRSRNNRLLQAAVQQIAADVGEARERYGAHRIAVVLGTSTSGIDESEAAFKVQRETGAWPEWFAYEQLEAGAMADFIADYLELDGPAYVIATACSSSAKVFASARRLIELDLCDAAIVGGADSLCRMTLNGFNALGALSPGLCNPFSVNRDGINIGEAAVVFLMSREAAPVELLGCGEACDAYHISAPEPGGLGAIAAISQALRDSGLDSADIGYVNLHGTGTEHNDKMESIAVNTVLGPAVPTSSTKSLTGHTLGAAGAVEAAFLWLALHPDYGDGLLPPHVWDGIADPDLAEIELTDAERRVDLNRTRAMLSSSFAFGGNNVSLIFGRAAT